MEHVILQWVNLENVRLDGLCPREGHDGGMRLTTEDLLGMTPGEELRFFTDFPGRHRALITQASKRHRVKFEKQYINGVLVVRRVDDDEGRHPKVLVPLRLGIPVRGSRIRAVAEIDHVGNWKVKSWELDAPVKVEITT